MSDLKDLEGRIKAAKKDKKEGEVKRLGDDAPESEESKRGKRAASEFLASVIAGALLGHVIDRFVDTAPLMMILFILLGFVSGVYRANAVTKKSDDT